MNPLTLFTLSALLLAPPAALHAADVANLRCEYRNNPLGIDVAKPRLSWVIESTRRGEEQTAYQVLVASTPELLAKDQGDLWDSRKVASDQSIQLAYAGKPLESQMQCHWKVRVWDKNEMASAWSVPATWTMGLVTNADWQGAKWIGGEGKVHPTLLLRREFVVKPGLRRATVFVMRLPHIAKLTSLLVLSESSKDALEPRPWHHNKQSQQMHP